MGDRAYSSPGLSGVVASPLFKITDTLLSPAPGKSLWDTCPLRSARDDVGLGYLYHEDFFNFGAGTGGWIVTQATTGTAVAGALAGGNVRLSAGAATANQGANLQYTATPWLPAAASGIWFEARVQVSTLVGQYAIGLSAANTTLIASGALNAANFIGFSSVTGDGVLLPQCIKASAAATVATSNTLVASTFVKLGFVVDALGSVTYYVNGVAGPTVSTGATNIPIVALAPIAVCQAAGTGTPTMDIDYFKVFQTRATP